MNFKLPISLRLTLFYSALFMSALLLFGYLSYLFVSRELYNDQFNYLSENAELISEAVRFRHGELDMDHLKEETDELKLNQQGIFYKLVTDSFDTILKSRNFPPYLVLNTFRPGPNTLQENGSDLRYSLFATSLQNLSAGTERTIYVYVGQSVFYVQRVVQRIRMLMLFLAPVVLLLAAAGGWLMARRFLRPVSDITHTARDISLHELSKRLTVPAQNDELKQLVLTFNDMIERIESGVKQIQQFTADVSHELRTPLTVLRGELEVTLRKERSGDDYRKTLSSALQELGWMERIVNDLLLLSRADAGRLIIRKEKSDLAELIKECVEAQSRPAADKKIHIECHNTADQFPVLMDVDRMRQVVLNLLDNALKFTPQNGHITLSLEKRENAVLLTVQDDGIGIPEQDIPLVFDRFYRADKSRSRDQRSSGLGLSICKWIVEAHGGHIDIMSKEGQGSTVRVLLPA